VNRRRGSWGFPADCKKSAESVRGCLATKRIGIQTFWGWETNHSVALRLNEIPDIGPSVTIMYTTPESTRFGQATGL
jgi:hypothetical protein